MSSFVMYQPFLSKRGTHKTVDLYKNFFGDIIINHAALGCFPLPNDFDCYNLCKNVVLVVIFV